MASSAPPEKDSKPTAVNDDDLAWADREDVNDLNRAQGIWGHFLKKDPSPEFLADVAVMNARDLDPKEVKRIERKIDWLIIPALSVCYMVRRPPSHHQP